MAVAQSKRSHCRRGHAYNEENTCYSGGRRHCLQCAKERRAAKRQTLPTREEKIWARVQRGEVTECWPWIGSQHREGYGSYGKPARLAHRVVYEIAVGPIPDGCTLDHTCHNADDACPGGRTCPHRRCVNPAHLEPVTPKVNVLRGQSQPAVNARKTQCPAGHPYDAENTLITKNGWRTCRTCNRERARARRGGGAQ